MNEISDKSKFLDETKLEKNMLIDFSYLCHKAKYHKDVQENGFQINMWKHLILSGLFKAKKKFKPDNVYIVCDSRHNWRYKYFKFYKYKRVEKRKLDKEGFDEFFKEVETFITEIKNNFPYYVLRLDGTEGDDIIGTFCKMKTKNCVNILISPDKDFRQLQRYDNFVQYCPLKEDFLIDENWNYELFTQCVKGDTSDSIPNIKMPDNTFAKRLRQKPIYKTKIDEWYKDVKKGKKFTDDSNIIKNFQRNCKLIRLDFIPKKVSEKITDMINSNTKVEGSAAKMKMYFMEKDMKVLLDELETRKI